ncbi:MAG: hypothetical protein JJU13_01460 [Balneolaceae bacterium]|nr:hypothetical protein [Balneolaceae bacterium]
MGEETIIVAIVFGSVITIVFLGIVGSIIKAWVKKGSGKSLTENQEFLAALREFKEKTDRRLANLEAIVTDDKKSSLKSRDKEQHRKEQKNAIEIEIETEAQKEEEQKSSKLKNMLNQ